MAVLGRLLLGSAERLDLPDLLSVDSYSAADFKYLIQSFAGGDKPYILKGFDVIQPQDAIGTESISIRVADSVVYYPASKAGAFYYGLPEGNPNAEALIPELRKNATNFIYLTFTTSDGAKDSRAFWDPDQNGGDGGEFSQDVNTESVLSVEVNVSVSAFPEDTIPICKVTVGASVVEAIQDCRDMMFRLGTGGVAPDPFADYDFRDEPSSTYARNEPYGTMTSALDPNPFEGGDKNIQTLKEWMDAVMTRIKEIGGTTYWYQAPAGSSTPSVANVFLDALGSTIKSKGKWQHSNVSAGAVTFTEDLHYTSVKDSRLSIIRASALTLADDQVAWINLIRDRETNNSHAPVTWQNGSVTVNGVVGSFENLAKGDWVKKKTDTDDKYLRIEEFYSSTNLGGGTTTAALAQSVRLSGVYAGATGSEIGIYTKGEYLLADIQITARNAASVQNAGGNFLWLAYRSDTVLGLASIVPTQLTLNFTEGDGTRIKATSTGGPHGLVDNDQITVTTGPHQGTYKVEVESTTVFYINTATTNSATGSTAFYAVVTTAARSTAFSFNLESANHGFSSNETISIANTSTAYDGTYSINVRSATTFQIPIGSLIPNPGAMSGNIVRLAKVNVRTEFSAVKLVQGETISIGDGETENIRAFIGMESLAQNRPVYKITPGYNTIDGHQNFNADPNDDLTQRASKLTSMMADRVQDRAIRPIASDDIRTVTNTTNTNQQEITFAVPGSTLTITTPGSNGTTTVNLPSVAPGISLGLNHVAYVTINRNATSTSAITVVDAIDFVLDENTFVIATRELTNDVTLWDGQIVPVGSYPYNSEMNTIVRQNLNLRLIGGGTWDWILGSGGAVSNSVTPNDNPKKLNVADSAYAYEFTADGAPTSISTRSLSRSTAGTAILVGEIWTYDGTDKPGALVSTSTNTVDISTLDAWVSDSTIYSQTVFNFASPALTPGTKYYFVVRYSSYTSGQVRMVGENIVNSILAMNTQAYPDWSVETPTDDGDIDLTINYPVSPSTLSWDEDAYVQVPGMTNSRNTIPAGSVDLEDGEIAYVSINRYGVGADTLTISVIDVVSYQHTTDKLVIARRDGDSVAIESYHTQYARLRGRDGGQILHGGTDAGSDLILRSTLNAAKGQVVVDETTASTSTVTGALRVDGGIGVADSVWTGNQVVAGGTLRSKSGVYWEKQDTVTTSTALTINHHLVLVDTTAAGADITLTLPASDSSNKGQVIIVKDVAGFVSTLNKAVILAATGGDLILSGEATPLRMDIDWFSITLVSGGNSRWYVI